MYEILCHRAGLAPGGWGQATLGEVCPCCLQGCTHVSKFCRGWNVAIFLFHVCIEAAVAVWCLGRVQPVVVVLLRPEADFWVQFTRRLLACTCLLLRMVITKGACTQRRFDRACELVKEIPVEELVTKCRT